MLHIRKKVVEALKPQLLFFLNSHFLTSLRRDYLAKDRRTEVCYFSCDLLTILPDNSPLLQDDTVMQELESKLLPLGKVNLIIYPMERFVRELQNKTFFLPTIYHHAILLHEHGDCFQKTLRLIYPEPAQKPSPHQEARLPEPASVNSLHPLFSYVFYAHCLNQEEIKNPFIVLFRFFDMADFINARREVNFWMEAIGQGRDWKKNEAAKQLTLYEAVNKLIEAVHFINKMDNSDRPAVIAGLPEQEHVQRILKKTKQILEQTRQTTIRETRMILPMTATMMQMMTVLIIRLVYIAISRRGSTAF